MTTDNPNNKNLKKNFSEKDIINGKLNINTNNNQKKIISINKRKSDNI